MRQRRDLEGDVAVLPAAAGLLLVLVARVGLLRDRLAVGNFRRAHVDFNVVAPLHAVEHDLQVQVPDP